VLLELQPACPCESRQQVLASQGAYGQLMLVCMVHSHLMAVQQAVKYAVVLINLWL